MSAFERTLEYRLVRIASYDLPPTATHPSTNRTRRRVTSLKCATPLPPPGRPSRHPDQPDKQKCRQLRGGRDRRHLDSLMRAPLPKSLRRYCLETGPAGPTKPGRLCLRRSRHASAFGPANAGPVDEYSAPVQSVSVLDATVSEPFPVVELHRF